MLSAMIKSTANHDVAELKTRADDIRARFDENARRPVVIEFAGMPKAGKTTIVNEIHRFLKRCGFRTKVIAEKASICPVRDKKDASFNIWTVCQTLSDLLVDTQSPPHAGDPEIVIIDRGIFDAVSWLRLLERLRRLQADERNAIERFVLLGDWRKRISQVFVLTVDPDEALAREEGLIPISVLGSIMNREVLAQTRDNVLKCADDLEAQFNIKIIDTSGKETAEIARRIAGLVLDAVDNHLDERILSLDKGVIEPLFGGKSIKNAAEATRILEAFATTGDYESRPVVEANNQRVQALPVLVVRNAKGSVLRLRRKERDRKNTLHNRLVLWAGGHVREEDGTNGKALVRCLLREAKEELKLNIVESEVRFLGAVWERHSTAKTQQHVALVFEWRAQSEDVEVCLSNAEFFERRGTSLSGKFVPVKDILALQEHEPWSAAILSELLPDIGHAVQKHLI